MYRELHIPSLRVEISILTDEFGRLMSRGFSYHRDGKSSHTETMQDNRCVVEISKDMDTKSVHKTMAD